MRRGRDPSWLRRARRPGTSGGLRPPPLRARPSCGTGGPRGQTPREVRRRLRLGGLVGETRPARCSRPSAEMAAMPPVDRDARVGRARHMSGPLIGRLIVGTGRLGTVSAPAAIRPYDLPPRTPSDRSARRRPCSALRGLPLCPRIPRPVGRADVAQMAEHITRNDGVLGSIFRRRAPISFAPIIADFHVKSTAFVLPLLFSHLVDRRLFVDFGDPGPTPGHIRGTTTSCFWHRDIPSGPTGA